MPCDIRAEWVAAPNIPPKGGQTDINSKEVIADPFSSGTQGVRAFGWPLLFAPGVKKRPDIDKFLRLHYNGFRRNVRCTNPLVLYADSVIFCVKSSHTKGDRLCPRRKTRSGTMPVNRLLLTMSLPMVISMLVQALYNIVDSIYVSQISENALTAVSLAFPIQNLMIAFASGTGVGVNALLSKSLGQKNFEQADRAAANGVIITVFNILLFVLIGAFGSRADSSPRRPTSPKLSTRATQYMTVCATLCFGIFGEIMFERLLQSTGKTMLSMITQSVGAIINIVLDPIMIFGYFGMPAMGDARCGARRVIGQIVAVLLAVILNAKFNHEVHVRINDMLRPHGKTIGAILKVGVPSIAMISIGSIMNFCMNLILLSFTATAAAVFGVYFKLQSFVFMPIFGMNNGLVPIIAYNYGARSSKRILQAYKLATIYAMSYMLAPTASSSSSSSRTLLGFFDASEQMLSIGDVALRIISISFLFAGFNIVSGSIFQALGNGLYSLIVSVARQLVALLPIAFLLSKTGNVDAVWWAFPISEVISTCLTLLFVRNIYRDRIKPLDSAPAKKLKTTQAKAFAKSAKAFLIYVGRCADPAAIAALSFSPLSQNRRKLLPNGAKKRGRD